jgi:hypothetical protein
MRGYGSVFKNSNPRDGWDCSKTLLLLTDLYRSASPQALANFRECLQIFRPNIPYGLGGGVA